MKIDVFPSKTMFVTVAYICKFSGFESYNVTLCIGCWELGTLLQKQALLSFSNRFADYTELKI